MFVAWERFTEGKHSKSDVMAFEFRLEDNLFALCDSLSSGEYRHDPYKPFTIHDPKQRRIHKATVKDRVVHQAIVNVVEPLFEPRFIHDSYSCRAGKGTHAAVDRLRLFLRQASCNDTRTIYALKCDVKKFFASVDHAILLPLLVRQIQDPGTIHLLEGVLGSFSSGGRRGIPLGNLTSQLFANVYLHELDWYVKMTMREKYYLRYCDDFIIVSESSEHLSEVVQMIEAFLHQALKLELHPNKVLVRTWGQGIDFLGYVLFPHATVLRRKTASRIVQRVNENNLASYLGVSSHADAHDFKNILKTAAWSV